MILPAAIPLALLVAAALALVPSALDQAAAQEGAVPGWIKHVAGFWSDGHISDGEFLEAIKYLVQNGIIVIPEDGADTGRDGTGPGAEPATIEIVSYRATVHDILIAETSGNEGAVPGFLSKLAINHIWIAKDLYGLDDEKKVDSIKSFLESLMADIRAGDTYNKKADRIKSSLDNDKDFEGFVDDVSFDDLVRYNDRHVGQEMFFEGTADEVVDLQGDGQYEVLIDIGEINFNSDVGAVVAEYAGPRIRDGDNILVAGTVSGLEVREIDNINIITKLKSDDRRGNAGEAGENIAGDKAQVEIPTVTVSHIQILTSPEEMTPEELERAALEVSYGTLEENEAILMNSIVYYRGTVTSVEKDGDGLVQEFRLDVNPSASDIDIITVLKGDDTISVSRYDKVGVYGPVAEGIGVDVPVVKALHIQAE